MTHWLKKYSWLAGILAAAALLVAAAVALLPGTTEGETAMSATDSTPQAAIPLLDEAGTAITETATFAMG